MDDAAENAELVSRIASRDPGARDAEAELCRRFAPRAQLYGRRHLRDADGARDLAPATGEILVACQRHFGEISRTIVFEVRTREASGVTQKSTFAIPHVFEMDTAAPR
jgi:hypothetical protein